jgi:hypothetical protein
LGQSMRIGVVFPQTRPAAQMPAHTDTNGTGTQTLTPKPGV